MRFNQFAAAVLFTATLGATGPAFAQTADMTAFDAACAASQPFLLGDVPAEIDADALMTVLCACVNTTFQDMSQAEIDMLTTDLNQTSTEETHAAYTDYAGLQQKAGEGLAACFSSPEVIALIPSEPAEPTAPAAPVAP